MKNFLTIIFCLSFLCMSIGASCSTCVIEKTSNRDLSTSYCKDTNVQNICTLQSDLYITKDIVLYTFNAGLKSINPLPDINRYHSYSKDLNCSFKFFISKINQTAMQDQKPTIGRFVHYKPSEVERKRMKDANNCNESSLLPAVITAVWSDSCVNLKVLLDGEGDLWATSRSRGENEGNWDWPVKS